MDDDLDSGREPVGEAMLRVAIEGNIKAMNAAATKIIVLEAKLSLAKESCALAESWAGEMRITLLMVRNVLSAGPHALGPDEISKVLDRVNEILSSSKIAN